MSVKLGVRPRLTSTEAPCILGRSGESIEHDLPTRADFVTAVAA
jgi:hypothetical protein